MEVDIGGSEVDLPFHAFWGVIRISFSGDFTRQFITTSAEVTPKGSSVRESYPKWP